MRSHSRLLFTVKFKVRYFNYLKYIKLSGVVPATGQAHRGHALFFGVHHEPVSLFILEF